MKFYRTNQQIQSLQLRVLGGDNKQLGILGRTEALAKAQEQGLDLVEIAPNARPPVCRIIDFKKFRYLEAKKQRESRKKAKTSDLKELRLGPFMSDNDLRVRLKRAKEFLKEGHKLRLAVKFAGRQITHPEFGWQVLNKFIKEVEEFGRIERAPKFEGKTLAATLTPGRTPQSTDAGETKYGKAENEKGSGQTLQNNKNG